MRVATALVVPDQKLRNLRAAMASVNGAAVAAGLTAGLGYTFGAIPLFLDAVRNLGLSPAAQGSWFFIIFASSGIASLVLSLYYRQPLPVGWSGPGLLFLAAFGSRFTLSEIAGAGLAAGIVILGLGLLGMGNRIVRWIPPPIVLGVFVGSVLSYASGIFAHLGTQPWTVGATLAGYLVARSLGRSWLPPMGGAVGAGLMAALVAGQIQPATLVWSPPVLLPVWPVIHPTSLLALSVPLVILALGVGGVQGVGMLESQGYRPPTRLLTVVLGINSIANATFGGHPASMQAQSAAILAGPEAGPREQRYVASLIASGYALLLALGAGVAGNLVGVVPAALVASLAGLAMVSAVADALRKSMGSSLPTGAFFSLAIAASPLTILGIGSALWALLGGLLVSVLLERDALWQWWKPTNPSE